jgi:hypothetical protein
MIQLPLQFAAPQKLAFKEGFWTPTVKLEIFFNRLRYAGLGAGPFADCQTSGIARFPVQPVPSAL